MGEENVKCAEWQTAEQLFGCEFVAFERMGLGNSSSNFHAATHDGREYLVKVASNHHIVVLRKCLRSISSPLVPSLAFGGTEGRFGRRVMCALEWCERGRNVAPHLLTEAQMRGILKGYEKLEKAFSAVDREGLGPSWKGLDEAARACAMTPRPIHGDFHYRNYFVDENALTACFDLECMRIGLPTEDLFRIFVHALERTHLWDFEREKALFRNFRKFVGLSSYSEAAWLAAIELHVTNKSESRMAKHRFAWTAKIDMFLRSPLYRRLQRTVREAKRDGATA